MSDAMPEMTPPPNRAARRRRRGRGAAAVVAGLLLLTGCTDEGDAGIEGDAPEADDDPPLDPDPEVQENAPNVEDPDLSGDETPDVEPPSDIDGEAG